VPVPAVLLLWFSLAAGVSHPARVAATGSLWQRLGERCASAADERLPRYPWPLAPFHRQHPVRGYFGDPRTVIYGTREGVFSFHNGIDIAAWPGNRVYPVVSGRVARVIGDEIVVASSGDRRFQYIHLLPKVRPGSLVTASRTVLGTVFRPWNHVHLTEIRGDCVVNPLGHLTPFVDRTRPEVLSISFRNPAGRPVGPGDLSGNISVVADAEEHPAMAAAGVWRRMPVTPALVTWKITTLRGRRLLGGIAADFRVTEPPPAGFCAVYAPATVQNFVAENGHYRWGRAGRYLFWLQAGGIATGDLPTGRYELAVTAQNIVGTTGRRTVTIELHHLERPQQTSTSTSDWRCPQRTLVDTKGRYRIDDSAARNDGRAPNGTAARLARTLP
jgi:hypothetical protein